MAAMVTPTAPTMTEADFQAAVLELARLFRWRVAHFRAARTAHGWRTPVAADGAGWPDLFMVRGGRAVVAELKSESGRLRPEQREWLIELRACPGLEVFVWRPSDLEEIARILR